MLIIYRIRAAWRELCGQHTSPLTLAKEDLEMALEKFKALAAQVEAATDRLIALAHGTDGALTDAQHALTDADDAAAATIQPILDKLNAAAPALIVDEPAAAAADAGTA